MSKASYQTTPKPRKDAKLDLKRKVIVMRDIDHMTYEEIYEAVNADDSEHTLSNRAHAQYHYRTGKEIQRQGYLK